MAGTTRQAATRARASVDSLDVRRIDIILRLNLTSLITFLGLGSLFLIMMRCHGWSLMR